MCDARKSVLIAQLYAIAPYGTKQCCGAVSRHIHAARVAARATKEKVNGSASQPRPNSSADRPLVLVLHALAQLPDCFVSHLQSSD